MGDKNFKWWCGGGKEPEVYFGPFDSRDDAMGKARAEYPDGHFTICEADKAVLSFDMFAADRLLEDFEEHNNECWGEDGMDVCLKPTEERALEKHMADAFRSWLEASSEMPVAWAIGETRTEEYHPPVSAPAES